MNAPIAVVGSTVFLCPHHLVTHAELIGLLNEHRNRFPFAIGDIACSGGPCSCTTFAREDCFKPELSALVRRLFRFELCLSPAISSIRVSSFRALLHAPTMQRMAGQSLSKFFTPCRVKQALEAQHMPLCRHLRTNDPVVLNAIQKLSQAHTYIDRNDCGNRGNCRCYSSGRYYGKTVFDCRFKGCPVSFGFLVAHYEPKSPALYPWHEQQSETLLLEISRRFTDLEKKSVQRGSWEKCAFLPQEVDVIQQEKTRTQGEREVLWSLNAMWFRAALTGSSHSSLSTQAEVRERGSPQTTHISPPPPYAE